MSKFADAIGYLSELEKELNLDWFSMVCDLSRDNPKEFLSGRDIDFLKMIYSGSASYLRLKNHSKVWPSAAQTQSDFLEGLEGFNNFKRIQDTFSLKFSKRINIIFGHNGSGKSSICDALKILANHETPTRPIQNVRLHGNPTPAFSYKFKNESTNVQWTMRSGFGSQHHKIKYFDSSIAAKTIRDNMEPGKVVELTPFNMIVFESVKSKIFKLKEVLQIVSNEIATKTEEEIKQLKSKFTIFPNSYFGKMNDFSIESLKKKILEVENFVEDKSIESMLVRLSELEKATSVEGQKLLSSEIRDFDSVIKYISEIKKQCESLVKSKPIEVQNELDRKLQEQKNLNSGLLPKEGTLEAFVVFLKEAAKFCNLASGEDQECPLCRRKNELQEKTLFRKYFDLLQGQIEKEIGELRAVLRTSSSSKDMISNFDEAQFELLSNIDNTQIKSVVEIIRMIKSNVVKNLDFMESLIQLRHHQAQFEAKHIEKQKTLETVKMGSVEIEKEKSNLSKTIENYKSAHLESLSLASFKKLLLFLEKKSYWAQSLPRFTPILKKITDTEKAAYEDLVVSDFHKRLESEYRNLAEKDISTFGVVLSKKGSATGVSVLARIGGNEIMNILSEGEQRLHSLALFFAELETSKQSVIVFDDPVSSFDYDYITNYCFRLRDFAHKHINKQVVILTHNWEFFVNLQLVLNKHGLNDHLSVNVLEGCSFVASYSEKIDELKTEIQTILSQPGEPSKYEKEATAGRMRRLIEAIVNSHVFNNQRHQYKQKSSSTSDFQKYTKLTSLLSAEATDLRDLFEKLSITEHDDPRNAYVNSDKAMFQTRFDKITSIETAILGRK